MQKNNNYKLEDIIEHNYLFKLYPELKNYDVVFKDKKSTKGSYNEEYHLIELNNNYLDSNNYKELKGTLLHEIQHAIQHIEGFESGQSSKLSKLAYFNSLGEIEANVTKNRYMNDLSKDDRYSIAPESSKVNAKHSQYDNYMKNRKIIDKTKDAIYPYIERIIKNDKTNQEVVSQNSTQNNKLVDERGLLENNSSFSLDKESKKIYDNTNYKFDFALGEANKQLSSKNYVEKETGLDSKGELIRKIEYYTQFKKGLFELQKIQQKENLVLFKSPYGDSYYLTKEGESIDWGYKPEGSYRLSDHWNWNDGKECPTDTNTDFKLAIGKYQNGKYTLVTKLSDLSAKNLIWGLDVKKSISGSDKWQEHLEKNYKATGTRTNMQDIRLPKANNNQNKVNLPINKELKENNKIQDPIEVSNLTKEDTNTMP